LEDDRAGGPNAGWKTMLAAGVADWAGSHSGKLGRVPEFSSVA